jgi:hypothetical protein
MGFMLTFEGTPATLCAASATHSPVPLRYVWHHVQPQEAGGQTVRENLVQLCDSCHYTIHRLMWIMRLIALGQAVTPAQQKAVTTPPRRAQLVLAGKGYEACRLAGTIAKIPNEG